MFKCTIFCVLLLTLRGCNGIRVHIDFEDIYEDTDDILQDTRYHSFQIIAPGTKWCGAGNIADNDDDLGKQADTDRCCREHDFCDDYIEAKQTKHGLTNDRPFTKMHCKCDQKFHDCLQSNNKNFSDAIGAIYFNYLNTKCFRKDYPIVKCIKHYEKRCIEYELDKSQPKIYEWFDVPAYIKKNKV